MRNTTRATAGGVAVVHGEEEVYRRTAHLLENATTLDCATNTLAAWRWTQGTGDGPPPPRHDAQVRKVYRTAMLLDPAWTQRMSVVLDHPQVDIRVTSEEVNETVIIDGRLAILSGDMRFGARSYSLITQRETVLGIRSLFDAAWRSATDLAAYDATAAEIRLIAPQVLDLLGRGVKDEAAARELGLSVRTYRRRVADLMTALGADSRFQAGARARELGLI